MVKLIQVIVDIHLIHSTDVHVYAILLHHIANLIVAISHVEVVIVSSWHCVDVVD